MRRIVLVVEANTHAGKLFKSCLEQGGYHAMATDDTNKALKLARAWQPDLVMIDIHLANNAAARLVESIRNVLGNSSRIVLTFCDNLEKVSSLASQVDALFPKPLDCWRLANAVDELLNTAVPTDAKVEFITLLDRSVRQVSTSPAA
jgi:DNA-binding response OmpR family regulator